MKLLLISDLHLEFEENKKNFLDFVQCLLPTDILLVAGDVTRSLPTTVQVGEMLSEKCRHVIMVPGNHDFEGAGKSPFDAVSEFWHSEIPNLHLLYRNSVEIDGLVFSGTTFWPSRPKKATQKFDLPKIDPEWKSWLDIEHSQDVEFFESCHNTTDLFISHMAPTQECCNPIYLGQGANWYFYNREEVPEDSRIRKFVFGHTHTPYEIGKFRVNPYGYPFENNGRPLTPAIVEIS